MQIHNNCGSTQTWTISANILAWDDLIHSAKYSQFAQFTGNFAKCRVGGQCCIYCIYWASKAKCTFEYFSALVCQVWNLCSKMWQTSPANNCKWQFMSCLLVWLWILQFLTSCEIDSCIRFCYFFFWEFSIVRLFEYINLN